MIKVNIYQPTNLTSLHVYVIDDQYNKSYILRPKGSTWEQEEIKEAQVMEPSFVIPRGMGGEFMSAMANALRKHGFGTDEEATLKGTLDATKYHLSDMRQLMKLK